MLGKFFTESGESLKYVAQKSCGCAVAGDVQGHVAWGPEQTILVLDLVGRNSAHGRDLELDGL